VGYRTFSLPRRLPIFNPLAFIGLFLLLGTVWTPFNSNSTLPLIFFQSFALLVLLLLRGLYRRPLYLKKEPIDFLLIVFLFYSVLNSLLNLGSSSLNINHLIAEFSVVILYYFIPVVYVKNFVSAITLNDLVKVMKACCLMLFITGVADYVAGVGGVDLSKSLGFHANAVAGSGYLFRSRGFFVEPTDFGLALNTFFPLTISLLASQKKGTKTFAYLLMYLFLMVVARSTGAIIGAFIGLIFSCMVLSVRFLSGKRVILGGVALVLLCLPFLGVLTEIFSVVIMKASFSDESRSAVSRSTSYLAYLSHFDFYSLKFLTGEGTGFVSGQNLPSTLSWLVSIYVEKGVIGILLYFGISLFAFIRILKFNSHIVSVGLLITLVAVVVHLSTQTGFYFPFYWIALFLIHINWENILRLSNISKLDEHNK
jgi:hypothetical protein